MIFRSKMCQKFTKCVKILIKLAKKKQLTAKKWYIFCFGFYPDIKKFCFRFYIAYKFHFISSNISITFLKSFVASFVFSFCFSKIKCYCCRFYSISSWNYFILAFPLYQPCELLFSQTSLIRIQGVQLKNFK